MFSKATIAVAVIVCLSGVALSAPTMDLSKFTKNVFCESCISVVTELKSSVPDLKPEIDQLCNYCGSPEANQKCLDKIHEFEDKLEQEDPRQLCEHLGLCHAPHERFVDFMGQF